MNEHTSRGSNRPPLRHDLAPELVAIDRLQPLGQATRRHTAAQIRKITRSIETFGLVMPILVDGADRIIAGTALLEAARALELPEVPVVRLDDLTEAEARALRLALNRLAEDASWNEDELRIEIETILEFDADLDLGLTGLETAEIDQVLLAGGDTSDENALWPAQMPASVCQPGDCWILGEHRLLCGDALKPGSYATLMAGETARVALTDPPYNVPIEGHVSGRGNARHGPFAMASGEMSPEEFTAFLASSLSLMKANMADGGLLYVFMDWRHAPEMHAAAKAALLEQVNLVVWFKTNGGMGSLYRSAHELIFVFKAGRASHVNNVALGRHGRNRTNVWTYPGATVFGRGREALLALHPTVKPVSMLADAILDSTRRGDIVLDPFAGSGSTILAAEKTGRRCRAIEIDPVYCDAALARWQAMTGVDPVLEETGEALGVVLQRRSADTIQGQGGSDDQA